MKRKTKIVLGTLALYLGATGVSFAETDWTGFYVGVNAGQASGSSDVSTSTVYSPTGYFATTSPDAIGAAGLGSVDPSGFTGGLTAGYNWQSGSIVFGLEVDVNSLSVDDTRTATAVYPCCAPSEFTVTERTKANNLVTARGRLGYANDNSLFYVTAGWAQTKLKIDDVFTDNFANAQESFSDSKNNDGWIYGIGYEHGFNDNWSMKLEYLRADFGKLTGTSSNLVANTPPTGYPDNPFTHSADLTMNFIRFGVNYRF